VAEEQPQQNDHRNRHAQQPQQDSSSHHFLLKCDEEKTPDVAACSCAEKNLRDGTFFDSGISESDNRASA
jgi:hypothetical protein